MIKNGQIYIFLPDSDRWEVTYYEDGDEDVTLYQCETGEDGTWEMKDFKKLFRKVA
jgi:hypothetical protein